MIKPELCPCSGSVAFRELNTTCKKSHMVSCIFLNKGKYSSTQLENYRHKTIFSVHGKACKAIVKKCNKS